MALDQVRDALATRKPRPVLSGARTDHPPTQEQFRTRTAVSDLYPDPVDEPGDPTRAPRQWWVAETETLEAGGAPHSYRHVMCARSRACLDVALAEGWDIYACWACRFVPDFIHCHLRQPPRIIHTTGRGKRERESRQVQQLQATQLTLFELPPAPERPQVSACPECGRSKKKTAQLCGPCRGKARHEAGTVAVTCPNPRCGREHRIKRSYRARKGDVAGYCNRRCYEEHVSAA